MALRDLEGTSLAVGVQGQGRPTVLVHGTGVNTTLWGELPDRLAGSSRVVVYDRRGFGGSPGPAVCDYGAHARDLIVILEHVAREPATVIGWSAGGIVALEVALERPELVERLVLYEPPLHAKRHPSPDLIRTIVGLQLRRRVLRNEVSAARRFLSYVFDEGGRNAMDRWPRDFLEEVDRDAHASLLEIDAGTGEHLSLAQISELSIPVVGITGQRTSPMLRTSMARLRVLLPAMKVVTVSTGHAAHLDDPAGFAFATRA